MPGHDRIPPTRGAGQGSAAACGASTAAALTCAVLAAALLPADGGSAYADQPEPPAAAGHANGRLFTAPGTALGNGWKQSRDLSVTGTGDSAGFHILRADESTSFTYREVADLTETGSEDIGPWTGYVCTTASARYAAAVYAPSMAANKPAPLQHGAFPFRWWTSPPERERSR